MNVSNPKNYGNADIITEQSKPSIKLVMLRYEDMFDFYSEEPFSIDIKTDEKSDISVYEQILRIRMWNRNNQSYSWCIYANDRHEFNSIIIRKVTWDMENDKSNIKKYTKSEKEKLLSSWATIVTLNRYLDSSDSNEIIKMIKGLDLLIENGIMLYENANPTWEWRDLELLRLYDWGQIHNTWSTHRKNEDVENNINVFTSTLENFIELTKNNIYFMGLNYSIHPEKYKNILIDKF